MKKAWFKSFVGLQDLPSDSGELKAMFSYAEKQYILGQMAAIWLDKVDGKTKDLMLNALIRCDYDARMLAFERNRIAAAFRNCKIIPIVLKGGAYTAIGHQAGRGRRISDLDILVSEENIGETEKICNEAGYQTDDTVNNDYDQSYYRKWMHELPPLRHKVRGTILDIHHRLQPKTARIALDHAKLISDAVSLPDQKLKVLQPIDMFLHACVHSLGDGEFDTPARSLIELYYLYTGLSDEEKTALISRAKEVGGMKSLIIAAWLLDQYFDLEICGAIRKPSVLLRILFVRAIEGQAIGRAGLYIRGHYLRMPLYLLAGHLLRKLFIRRKVSPIVQFP